MQGHSRQAQERRMSAKSFAAARFDLQAAELRCNLVGAGAGALVGAAVGAAAAAAGLRAAVEPGVC